VAERLNPLIGHDRTAGRKRAGTEAEDDTTGRLTGKAAFIKVVVCD
jgi:hypothetical protein